MQEIDVEMVNLWAKERDELELEIECLIYPPSFKVTAISQQNSKPTSIKVQFTISEDKKDDFFCPLHLHCNSVSSPTGECICELASCGCMKFQKAAWRLYHLHVTFMHIT